MRTVKGATTMKQDTSSFQVYLPDTRDVEIARYMKGNTKLGANVYTYSRLPVQTCPGRTTWCEASCYAKRIQGPVRQVYAMNHTESVPPIPEECGRLRIHVSGDFTTNLYIRNWISRLLERPDVQAWSYTRSWRVSNLLENLEILRDLPNMELFASMDIETLKSPPHGWRCAWIAGDTRIGKTARSLLCPEQTGKLRDCESCRYCFRDAEGDVVFQAH